MATKTVQDGQWAHEFFGCFDDPATCLITYCLPCVQYGLNAEKVHSGECPTHGLKYCLFGCCCLSGLLAGPTRRTIRDTYKLPQQPEGLGSDDPNKCVNSDCLIHTIPCTACFALCQEANELRDRNPTGPLGPAVEDPFRNLKSKTQTTAPAQETMEKPVSPHTPAVTVEPATTTGPAVATTTATQPAVVTPQ